MEARPRLLDQVRNRLRTLHYSYRTEQPYLFWARRLMPPCLDGIVRATQSRYLPVVLTPGDVRAARRERRAESAGSLSQLDSLMPAGNAPRGRAMHGRHRRKRAA
jgi:hypothetical protein